MVMHINYGIWHMIMFIINMPFSKKTDFHLKTIKKGTQYYITKSKIYSRSLYLLIVLFFFSHGIAN